MMKIIRREDGQSIILIVMLLAVLLGLVAVVLDIGNAWAQRRICQNAADAAALAATRELGPGAAFTTNRQVLEKAKEYAEINGTDRASVVAWYITFDPDTQEPIELGVVPNTLDRPPVEAEGVKVRAGKGFNAFLAQVIGRAFMDASAEAWALITPGACTAGTPPCLFPAVVTNAAIVAHPTITATNRSILTTIWGDPIAPGNFQWVSWNQDPNHTSNPTLIENMQNICGDEYVAELDPSDILSDTRSLIYAGPGIQNSAGVRAELDDIIYDDGIRGDTDYECAAGGHNNRNPVTIPIYNEFVGVGEGLKYYIPGVIGFCITDYLFSGPMELKHIDGYFMGTEVVATEGGCDNPGTYVIKLRPPMSLDRCISGRVAYEHLEIAEINGENIPVDVVNVIDVSGSMGDAFGSDSRIDAAKNVMVHFNDMLRSEVGDQAGLVKFPVELADDVDIAEGEP